MTATCLQYFKERDIGVLGVEPAANVARVAIEKGIATESRIFRDRHARAWWRRAARPI